MPVSENFQKQRKIRKIIGNTPTEITISQFELKSF